MEKHANMVGGGKVVLIAGGGKTYADVAARFCKSARAMEKIAFDSPESKELVDRLVSCGHTAALEFDYFIFGVEGYSRVTETQLVRKRVASYMISSGRAGNCEYNTILPRRTAGTVCDVLVPVSNEQGKSVLNLSLSGNDLNELIRQWYQKAIEQGLPPEDARYLKPQGTEFKAVIGMNARALREFFAMRCCRNAQHEIRDLAYKMLKLCKKVSPALFDNAGPACLNLGYCPQNELQNPFCKAHKKFMPKDTAISVLSLFRAM